MSGESLQSVTSSIQRIPCHAKQKLLNLLRVWGLEDPIYEIQSTKSFYLSRAAVEVLGRGWPLSFPPSQTPRLGRGRLIPNLFHLEDWNSDLLKMEGSGVNGMGTRLAHLQSDTMQNCADRRHLVIETNGLCSMHGFEYVLGKPCC